MLARSTLGPVVVVVVALAGVVGVAASGCSAFEAEKVDPPADASVEASADAKPDVIEGPKCKVAGEACGECCEGFNCISGVCCATFGKPASKADACCDGPDKLHNNGLCLDRCAPAGETCQDAAGCCLGLSCAHDQEQTQPADICYPGACVAVGQPCSAAQKCCIGSVCELGGADFVCVKK